ncbi:MAG: efflux RND transporter periplasmic adaptor subunit [Acidobacteriota bacterium]|nr:efflux RND transporter periplasmic adaptor subunit [Acidobacteriota bacterium]
MNAAGYRLRHHSRSSGPGSSSPRRARRPSLRSTAALLAGSALVLLLASPATAREASRVELDPQAEARAGVRVEAVDSQTFDDRVRTVGRIVRSPGATVTVKALVEGRVDELYVAPGDSVKAGQALVTLHSHDLHTLKAQYLRAREAAKLAESRVSAGEQLLALEGISRLELDQRRQQALAARLEVDAVEAEMQHLGFRAGEVAKLFGDPNWEPRLTLRAPNGGVVLDLEVETHGWVERLAPLMMIGDPQRLELELQIPPDQADRVQPGDRVSFVPVGRPELGGTARVITRVPAVDPTTRTVTVRAEILDGGGQSLPGVFVEGTVLHGTAETMPVVPVTAVIRLAGSDHVFVRVASHTYEARPVRIGRAEEGRYEVLDGLRSGENVAVEGVFLLKSALLRSEDAP